MMDIDYWYHSEGSPRKIRKHYTDAQITFGMCKDLKEVRGQCRDEMFRAMRDFMSLTDCNSITIRLIRFNDETYGMVARGGKLDFSEENDKA